MAGPTWRPVPGAVARVIEENWLFQLVRERYRSNISGKEHDFYVMRLADSVNVIATTTDHNLVMVRQFRAGSGEDSLEIPGGLLNPGEDAAVAGARELLEETGYAGDTPTVVGSVWSNPSIMNSRSTTIHIANARRVAETDFDPGEELSLELLPEGEVLRAIRDGRINHALVVTALLSWRVEDRP